MDVKEILRRLDLIERVVVDTDSSNSHDIACECECECDLSTDLDSIRAAIDQLRVDIEIDCLRDGVTLVTC